MARSVMNIVYDCNISKASQATCNWKHASKKAACWLSILRHRNFSQSGYRRSTMEIKKPNRKRQTYVQTISAIPEMVFPLLCPVMECEWVHGWQPDFVLSNSGGAEKNCIFATTADEGQAIWIITKHDPVDFELEMYKITPKFAVTQLEASLSQDGAGQTAAEISYTHTSLGPEGDQFLEEFTFAWYQNFMQRWEKSLNHYLETGLKID